MRWMLVALITLLQAVPLPPAYPRPGATKLFENTRVVVWDIAWLKQQYPLHRHPFDLTGVYYADGDRIIISESGDRRPVHTKAWDTAFQLKGVTHIEEGASDAPLRAVFVEMKEPSATGVVDTAATPAAFPAGGVKPRRDNERSLLWEFVPRPAAGALRGVTTRRRIRVALPDRRSRKRRARLQRVRDSVLCGRRHDHALAADGRHRS